MPIIENESWIDRQQRALEAACRELGIPKEEWSDWEFRVKDLWRFNKETGNYEWFGNKPLIPNPDGSERVERDEVRKCWVLIELNKESL